MVSETGIDLFYDGPVSRWLQIADDALEISLSHPCHDGPEVNSGLEVSCGKRRAELVQPEIIWV